MDSLDYNVKVAPRLDVEPDFEGRVDGLEEEYENHKDVPQHPELVEGVKQRQPHVDVLHALEEPENRKDDVLLELEQQLLGVALVHVLEILLVVEVREVPQLLELVVLHQINLSVARLHPQNVQEPLELDPHERELL